MYLDPVRPVNHARFVFLSPRAPDFYGEWERAADDTVAILRTEAGRDPYDCDLSDLVGELSTRSETFRTHLHPRARLEVRRGTRPPRELDRKRPRRPRRWREPKRAPLRIAVVSRDLEERVQGSCFREAGQRHMRIGRLPSLGVIAAGPARSPMLSLSGRPRAQRGPLSGSGRPEGRIRGPADRLRIELRAARRRQAQLERDSTNRDRVPPGARREGGPDWRSELRAPTTRGPCNRWGNCRGETLPRPAGAIPSFERQARCQRRCAPVPAVCGVRVHRPEGAGRAYEPLSTHPGAGASICPYRPVALQPRFQRARLAPRPLRQSNHDTAPATTWLSALASAGAAGSPPERCCSSAREAEVGIWQAGDRSLIRRFLEGQPSLGGARRTRERKTALQCGFAKHRYRDSNPGFRTENPAS